MLEESLTLFREVGDTKSAALALLNLADAVRDSGDLEQAAAQYREALAEFGAVEDRARVVDGLASLGSLLARQGQVAAAARLLGAASGLAGAASADNVSSEPEHFNADVASVRAALGEADFDAAWALGRGLSLQTAIAEALGQLSPRR